MMSFLKKNKYILVAAAILLAGSYGGYKDWAMLQRRIPSVTIEIGTRTAPLLETEFSNVWFRNRDVLPAVAAWVRGQ